MRLDEVRGLRWEHADFPERTVRVYGAKTGEPLMLQFSRQLPAMLERRWTACDESQEYAESSRVFASSRSRRWRDTQGAFEPRHASAEIAEIAGHPLAKIGHLAAKVGYLGAKVGHLTADIVDLTAKLAANIADFVAKFAS